MFILQEEEAELISFRLLHKAFPSVFDKLGSVQELHLFLRGTPQNEDARKLAIRGSLTQVAVA